MSISSTIFTFNFPKNGVEAGQTFADEIEHTEEPICVFLFSNFRFAISNHGDRERDYPSLKEALISILVNRSITCQVD